MTENLSQLNAPVLMTEITLSSNSAKRGGYKCQVQNMQIITINSYPPVPVRQQGYLTHSMQCTKTPTGVSANRSRKQAQCKIVHPGLDLVSFFGAHIFEWNIGKHNHHSLMSMLRKAENIYGNHEAANQQLKIKYESKREQLRHNTFNAD